MLLALSIMLFTCILLALLMTNYLKSIPLDSNDYLNSKGGSNEIYNILEQHKLYVCIICIILVCVYIYIYV